MVWFNTRPACKPALFISVNISRPCCASKSRPCDCAWFNVSEITIAKRLISLRVSSKCSSRYSIFAAIAPPSLPPSIATLPLRLFICNCVCSGSGLPACTLMVKGVIPATSVAPLPIITVITPLVS